MEQHNEMNLFDAIMACAKGIWKLVLLLWQGLTAMFRISWKRWWLVGIFVILGISGGWYYTRLTNKQYRVNGLVYINGPEASAVRTKFEALTQQTNPRIMDKQFICNWLDLPIEAGRIGDFYAFYVIDCKDDGTADLVDWGRGYSPKDTVAVRMQDRLMLQFTTKDPNLLPVVEEKLLAYLNADESFQRAYEVTRAHMARQHQYDHDQAEKLDSLTSAFYFHQGGIDQTNQKVLDQWASSGIVVGERQVKLFLDEIDEFFRIKQIRDARFEYCTAPVVLQDHFIMDARPLNRRSHWLIYGCLMGWVLGCFIALIVEYRKQLNQWLTKAN